MKPTIWFDQDGTLCKLYDVPNWLAKLRASDPSPYIEAEVMLNMSLLARYLNKVQKAGYQIGIISWLSKGADSAYNKAVTSAKLAWLHQHLHSVEFDTIHIVEYGTPKEQYAKSAEDILFDDNEEIRNDWTGKAYEPSEILSILSGLLHQE